MRTFAIIRIKMVVSVVQSIGIFFSLKIKKSVVRFVFAPSRDLLVLKHVLKKVHTPAILKRDRMD